MLSSSCLIPLPEGKEEEGKTFKTSLLPVAALFLIAVSAHKPILRLWKLSPAEVPHRLPVE